MIISEINGQGTVTITPIRAKYSDDSDCTILSVRATDDNFLNSATLQWSIMRYTSSGWQVSDSGTVSVSGSMYDSWDGNNETPFMVVAEMKGFIITS